MEFAVMTDAVPVVAGREYRIDIKALPSTALMSTRRRVLAYLAQTGRSDLTTRQRRRAAHKRRRMTKIMVGDD